jgi:hypothetical protein
MVDAREAVPVDGMDAREATMYPMVETALQVCLDAGSRLGEVVVVVGLGAVGILVAALLARTGSVVLGSEPVPARRSAADTFGVRALVPDDVADAVSEATGGRGADRASPRPWGCWRTRGRRWSAPGTARRRPRSLLAPRFTADGWPSAAPRSPASRPPSARGGTAAVAPRWPGGSHASCRSPPSAPMRSRSKRPPRPTPTRTGRRTA